MKCNVQYLASKYTSSWLLSYQQSIVSPARGFSDESWGAPCISLSVGRCIQAQGRDSSNQSNQNRPENDDFLGNLSYIFTFSWFVRKKVAARNQKPHIHAQTIVGHMKARLLCVFSRYFSSHFLSSPCVPLSLESRNSDPGSQRYEAGSYTPSPLRTVCALRFYRNKLSIPSSPLIKRYPRYDRLLPSFLYFAFYLFILLHKSPLGGILTPSLPDTYHLYAL